LPLIKFNPSSIRQTLDSCYDTAQALVKRQDYNCAAYQTYKCDQILKSTDVAKFGPATRPLRLPNPYGDVHSRNLTLFFLLNTGAAGNKGIVMDTLPNQTVPSPTILPQWSSCAP
jgi:hypothetical protein